MGLRAWVESGFKPEAVAVAEVEPVAAQPWAQAPNILRPARIARNTAGGLAPTVPRAKRRTPVTMRLSCEAGLLSGGYALLLDVPLSA